MPLVLVPILGAAPVVPIIAVSAMFTNSARIVAFRRALNLRRAVIALVAAAPTCVLGAWLYTLLTGRGAALVIGTSLIATVPLRRLLKKPRPSSRRKGLCRRRGRLGRAGRRHHRRRRHSIVAPHGHRPRRRCRDRDRCHGVHRHGCRQAVGVRPCRRAHAGGARRRPLDRRHRILHHLHRQADRRAAAGPRPHRDARRGGDRRRRR